MKKAIVFEWLLAQLRYRWVIHVSSVVLLSTAMFVTASVLLSPSILGTKAKADVGKVGLVLAGKGSGLQWVMASFYHIDVPPSNVGLEQMNAVLASTAVNAQIARQVRIALGDSVNGARLVGVDSIQDYFALFDANIEFGVMPSQPMQAAVGYDAAKRLNLKLGSQFFSAHGLDPGGLPMTILPTQWLPF
jgi:putative ABC transport system permease protein